MNFKYNDEGRKKYFKGLTDDCVVRAIAIALDKDYLEIYNQINNLSKVERPTKKGRRSNARIGVFKKTYHNYLLSLGFKWIACMKIGSGCKVHLVANELPKGRLIASVSKHLVAVIDGVINDTHDCSRNGKRCVYGYYIKTPAKDI